MNEKTFIEKLGNKAGLVRSETLAHKLFVESATTFAEGKELLR